MTTGKNPFQTHGKGFCLEKTDQNQVRAQCRADSDKYCDPISLKSGGQVHNALLISSEGKTFLKLLNENSSAKLHLDQVIANEEINENKTSIY
jgi:hypothetical protein